jgi:hypothetical protein
MLESFKNKLEEDRKSYLASLLSVVLILSKTLIGVVFVNLVFFVNLTFLQILKAIGRMAGRRLFDSGGRFIEYIQNRLLI